MKVSTIGLDLAKNVFQVHAVDSEGRVILRRKLRRQGVLAFFAGLEACTVAMEACATAHYWGRELEALGHRVRLIPPAYVKPYVKRGKKNDAADAEAICEAAGRPGMRFVPVKSVEQQALLMLHRARALLIRQRTRLINALRAHLAELGIVAAKGRENVAGLIARLDEAESGLPAAALPGLKALAGQIGSLKEALRPLDAEILARHRADPASRRLATIPGVGPIVASALAATMGEAKRFRSGRHFAAWLGLVPKQNSSGGKARLGRISKMGDRYLRSLLILGATSRLRRAAKASPAEAEWTRRLLGRRPPRLVTVALSNKMARVAWALLAHGQDYRTESKAL